MISLKDIIDSKAPNNSELTDIDAASIDDQKALLEAKRYSSDTYDRKWLAKWTAYTVTIWLIMVLATLILNNILKLGLSDSVIITLLGTTTLNVLGLSFIVLRGHFGDHDPNKISH
jgi:hypothetical protein